MGHLPDMARSSLTRSVLAFTLCAELFSDRSTMRNEDQRLQASSEDTFTDAIYSGGASTRREGNTTELV